MKKAVITLVAIICCILMVSCTESRQAESTTANPSTAEKVKDEAVINSVETIETKQVPAMVEQPAEPIPVSGNIKITANELKVRKEKSTDSEIVGDVSRDNVFELLEEGKDSDGKTWYRIEIHFGVTGWVAGWFCEKTDEKVNRQVKSEPGKLLIDVKDNVLFIDLLLEDDYSLDYLLQKYGNSYTLSKKYNWDIYTYDNGITFKVTDGSTVAEVGIGDVSTYVKDIRKQTCDIFSHKGEEILIFYDYKLCNQLLVLDAATKEVLRSYYTGYLTIDEFKAEDFLNVGSLQLYLYGSGNEVMQKDIYKVVDDDFIKVYDVNSFNLYNDGIKAVINNQDLDLDIHIGDYTASEKSYIPDRVIYNTNETKDKNRLLSVDPEWSVVKTDGKWYFKVRYTVNIIMLRYYWGPPGEGMSDNSTMFNDLARVDILVTLEDGVPRIHNVTHAVKYNNTGLLTINPMLYEEGVLVDGPELGMTMEEAYKSLGGDPNNYEATDNIELNGVSMYEFCGEVVDITVKTDKYVTVRGLKVGDTVDTVEKLYGKPDVGFSGDEQVEYKSSYDDEGLKADFYRGLTVYYKNGLVSEYNLYQIILD